MPHRYYSLPLYKCGGGRYVSLEYNDSDLSQRGLSSGPISPSGDNAGVIFDMVQTLNRGLSYIFDMNDQVFDACECDRTQALVTVCRCS